MPRKTPPFEHYEKWTTSRYWSFIRSALRRAWMRYPPRYEALAENRRAVTGKRHKWEHQCKKCKKWFMQKDIELDHRIPTGSLKCYEDLPGFVERLTVGKDGLDKLCKPCHKIKTAEERKNK